MQKILIIVDIQNDFCEGGSLATNDSNQVIPLINTLRNQPIFSHIVLTQDWHPSDHVSFASTHKLEPFTKIDIEGKKQELWPDHCVAGSRGADFSPLLKVKKTDIIVKKGIYSHADSYSGFFDDGKEIYLKRKLEEFGVKEIVICGLAFDFCVGSTALDAKKLGYDVTIVR
jgi:nicotinamidase-related amidase